MQLETKFRNDLGIYIMRCLIRGEMGYTTGFQVHLGWHLRNTLACLHNISEKFQTVGKLEVPPIVEHE